MTLLPSGPRVPIDETRARAGAKMTVPVRAAMSIPAWSWLRPVKGEIRGPNRDVNHPRVGHTEGIEASRCRFFSS